MDFNYLSIHQDELLSFLRANDYAETYVNRYRTTIKQITSNAGDQKWTSYEDVYQWYVDSVYSPTLVGGWYEHRTDILFTRACTVADNDDISGHHYGTGSKSNGNP